MLITLIVLSYIKQPMILSNLTMKLFSWPCLSNPNFNICHMCMPIYSDYLLPLSEDIIVTDNK